MYVAAWRAEVVARTSEKPALSRSEAVARTGGKIR